MREARGRVAWLPLSRVFGDHRPAWTAVGTSVLLSGTADVEMRVVAVVGSGKSSRVVYENPPEAPAAESGESAEER